MYDNVFSFPAYILVEKRARRGRRNFSFIKLKYIDGVSEKLADFSSFDETRTIEITSRYFPDPRSLLLSFSPPRNNKQMWFASGENCVEHTPSPLQSRLFSTVHRGIQPADGIKALSVNRFQEKERFFSLSLSPFPLADGRGKNFIKIPLVRGGSSMRVFPSVKAQLWNRRRRRRERVTQSDAPLFSPPPSLLVLSARSLHLTPSGVR